MPGRSYFRLRGGSRSVNLHIVGIDDGHWLRNLALREYLRNRPVARDKYGRAKRAAQASGATLLAYSEAKSRVVLELLGEAGIGRMTANPALNRTRSCAASTWRASARPAG